MDRTYIIAECGIAHRSSMKRAKMLIDCARTAGANAAKFQLYDPVEDSKGNKKLRKILMDGFLDIRQMAELQKYCEERDKRIDFLCSAFNERALQQLADIGLRTIKAPSIKLSDIEYLRKAAELFPYVIISTGLHTKEELESALLELRQKAEKKAGPKYIAVLQCTSAYPCPYEAVNLRAMQWLNLADKIGLSDHTKGWEVPVAAVAMGAEIIEKHLTLDETGVDSCCSLEPVEFRDMVSRIRNIEEAMGDGKKRIMECEESLLWRR